MPKPPVKTCACCGAKVVEYRHGLSRLLVKTLVIACRQSDWGRQPFHVSNNEAFTYSEASNFQKLRYWGFVQACTDEEHKEGWWTLTPFGRDFIEGAVDAPRYVWTFRGELASGHEDEARVVIFQVDPEWIVPRRPDYASTARARKDESQQSLF